MNARRVQWAVFAGALALFCLALVNTAWLCDDAYISYRAADNLVHGYGLRWNVNERVQAFTNPLWTLLNAAVYFVTREGYFTWLAVSAAVSIAAFVVALAPLRVKAPALWLAACWLIFSRAYVDFSTSGLENPLTHLLLALFVWRYLADAPRARPYTLAIIVALSALNRPDTGLLYLPALACVAWQGPLIPVLRAYMRGFAPLAAWLLFSLVYYGTPFPNTAYAKLGGALPFDDRIAHGLAYAALHLERDPVTLVGLAAGVLCALASRQARAMALGGGVLLYMLYIVAVGGDFMQGRLFTAPLLMAVLLIGTFPAFMRWRAALPVSAMIIWIASQQYVVSIVPHPEFVRSRMDVTADYAITDERKYYFQTMGLVPLLRKGLGTPQHDWAINARKERDAGDVPRCLEKSVIGMWGFFGGPKLHIIDSMALSDPFLARLPAVYNPGWRVGHLWRVVPEGYVESSLDDTSGIRDEDLAHVDNLVRQMVRGPLFSAARWKAIWTLTFTEWQSEIAPHEDDFRFPGIRRVYYSSLPRAPLAPEHEQEALRFSVRGIHVVLGEHRHDPYVVAGVSGLARFRALFMDGTEELGHVDLPMMDTGLLGIYEVHVRVPARATARGYDGVRILPFSGLMPDLDCHLGHFTLTDVPPP